MHRATLQALTPVSVRRNPAVRFRLALPLSLAISFSPHAFAQSLNNAEFQLDYSSSGVTSLKHVHDKYDTDYIARGRSLGDLLIRYRFRGEKDWKKASGAVLDPSDPASRQAVH